MGQNSKKNGRAGIAAQAADALAAAPSRHIIYIS
jgi:hypothetical protein